MAGPLRAHEIKAHRAGFRTFGPDPMPDRLFRVLRHEAFELRLGLFMLEVSLTARNPG